MGLKNLSAFQLNKKMERIYVKDQVRSPSFMPTKDSMLIMSPVRGRKVIITKEFNFVNIENPFQINDFNLNSIKLQRHKEIVHKNEMR